MSMSSQEILKALGQLQEATAEARRTIKEAHVARKDLLAAVKEQRDAITRAIDEEVGRRVAEISDETRDQMRQAVVDTMARFEADWRAKLGLG